MTSSDEMGRLTRQLSQSCDMRMAAIREVRVETAHASGEFRAAHRSMAAEQNRQLSEYLDALRRDVGELQREAAMFLKEAHAANREMAAEQHRRLNKSVDGMRHAAKGFVKEVDAAHRAMAAEQRRRLMAGRARLASDTSAMRLQFRREHDRLRADQQQARRIWNGFQADMQRRRAARPATFSSPPLKAAASPSPRPAGMRTDDLMAIRGIGSAMQRRLHDAGIRTYAQLAHSTAEQLRQALGEASRMASVEEWIAEARRLAGLG